MKIDIHEAFKTVNDQLESISKAQGVDVKIIEVLEKPFYWIFFYNSKLFIDTSNPSFSLAGNSPIIIDKIRGEIYETGTAYTIDIYIEEFEKNKLPTLLASIDSDCR